MVVSVGATGLAVVLSLVSPQGGGVLELGPSRPETVRIEDEHGDTIASAQLRPDAPARVHVPAGAYTVHRADGSAERVTVEEGQTASATRDKQEEVPEPSAPRLPEPPPPKSVPAATPATAWRAPLMSAFVPGLGHAWKGKPGWGVGIFAATLGSTAGAIALGLAGDRADGATSSDASRSSGYARLGGLAALSSVAAALYVGQIFDAYRLERGVPLRPRAGRVQLRVDRLSAVSMAPGRPRVALYDDVSIAAMVRVHPRVHVGASDASVKLGPGQTVLQLGARAMAEVYGSTASKPHRRGSVSLGGGVFGQMLSAERHVVPLDPDVEASRDTERSFAAVPYVLADARLFVAPRWSVGALGRLGIPLGARRYARGRALPAYAPTLEFGVSLGVNL